MPYEFAMCILRSQNADQVLHANKKLVYIATDTDRVALGSYTAKLDILFLFLV